MKTLALSGLLVLAGCGSSFTPGRGDGGAGPRDLTFVFPEDDMGGGADGGGGENECGSFEPSCTRVGFGPAAGKPFPLRTDMPPDPNANNDGVSRDKNGFLGLDSSMASFDYLWLANTGDWNRGTVSKLNSKTVREVARYFSVTCYSNKGGGKQNCDGTNGCCAKDSMPQWAARKAMMAPAPHQQVLLLSNLPSRTAVDFNGDVWVANRAFSGQSSATKIANDLASCVDRNGNGKIDTSGDTNGDGVIQTDCNADGQPDDILTVKNKACTNGMPQEFYGQDDECVLLTTNYNNPQGMGRPLSLGPGAQDFGPSDAWAGTYQDGRFVRIDGTTGLIKDEVKLPQGCQPYGLAVDSSAIGWAPPLNSTGPLCYFNTRNTQEVGTARNPSMGFTTLGYGISMDRDQNVWVAGCLSSNAYRYTPDRSMAFQKLGQGFWTVYTCPGCNGGATGNRRGIAVDSRSNNLYYAWMITDSGYVTRIEASSIPLPVGADKVVPAQAYPTQKVAGTYTIGVGVDRDQNIWGVSNSGAVATRIKVDAMGTMTPPDVVSPPMGNNKCPAGDRCPYQDTQASSPQPYTYSDFTGFGLRNFTRPKGFYSYVQKGCPDETRWVRVQWDADVPLNTSLTLRARAGKTPQPDNTWGAWSADFATSPADLVTGMPLLPNNSADAKYLQVEFDFATMDKNATPKLRSFDILFECPGGIG